MTEPVAEPMAEPVTEPVAEPDVAPIGVLVMAHGTPSTPEGIEPFYTTIRRGRPPPPELLDELVGRYRAIGGGHCPVVDTWWQTETGAIMIAPLPGLTTTKPGSATFPLPGIGAEVVDEEGNRVERGGGYLTLTRPWPSMLRGIYGDPDRYRDTCLLYTSDHRHQVLGSVEHHVAGEPLGLVLGVEPPQGLDLGEARQSLQEPPLGPLHGPVALVPRQRGAQGGEIEAESLVPAGPQVLDGGHEGEVLSLIHI